MGIGMIAVVPAAKLPTARMVLNRMNERHCVMGRIVKGERRVVYC